MNGPSLYTDSPLTKSHTPSRNSRVAMNLIPMPRTPIAELADGQSIDQAFRVADKQLRVNRDGGKYIFMKLGDRTGTLVAMKWNADQRLFESFERGDHVNVSGRCQIHKGALQVIVQRIDTLDEDQVNPEDFDRFDADATRQAVADIRDLVESIKSPDVIRVIHSIFNEDGFEEAFLGAPAAVSNHHAYPGGLAIHTRDLMRLIASVAELYQQLDRDLLLAGAFLHDLGKIDELSGGDELTYTDRGQLLGHIVIGLQSLERAVDRLDPTPDPEIVVQLQHMVVSHHGLLEYGSPRIPMTMEALVLHHLDNLDAKIASFQSVLDADVGADPQWTNFHPGIGRKLRKPSS